MMAAMGMADPQDPPPDRAALDELRQAFGQRSAPPSEQGPVPKTKVPPDDDDETLADSPSGAAPDEVGDEQDDILIVEQEPMTAEPEPPETPPKIIRIDDIGPSGHDADLGGAQPAGDRAPTVIAIADDDDLPDAVYVQGDLDGSGDRTVVFIEDDDTGDTLAPDDERDVRRGIEPRLRERRAAVKRAIGRKRLRWVLVATAVIVVGVGALAVLGSGLFAVDADKVDVYGAVYADPALVDAVIDDLAGTPVLRADTQAAEAALEAIPWVDQARVRVSFPNSATIEIREREAWTTYQGPDQRYRVLDRDGRVLAVLDGYPIAYLLLQGPDPVDLEPGQFAPQGYAAASELAKNLTGSVRGQVSSISVTADGSRLSLFLDDGTEVRFGAARNLFDKQLRLATILANNPEREPGVIDVSTSEVTL
jgi:cell division protein FtsQ